MKVIARAWHTTRKVMFSPEEMAADQLTLMPDGSGFINVHGSDTRLSQLIPDMIPLLYTGQRDKNTAERIYEGDIVTATWHWVKPHVIRLPDDYYSFEEFAIQDELTKLGNVYQNPELVNATDQEYQHDDSYYRNPKENATNNSN